MTGRILTCAYCGERYPQDTPDHGSTILTSHIKICPRHPMRQAEAQTALLRAALVGLVGVDGKEDLDQMEGTLIAMARIRGLDNGTAVSINAVRALQATLPTNPGETNAQPS